MPQTPQIFSPAYFSGIIFIFFLSAILFAFSKNGRENGEYIHSFICKVGGYNMIAYALFYTLNSAIM